MIQVGIKDLFALIKGVGRRLAAGLSFWRIHTLEKHHFEVYSLFTQILSASYATEIGKRFDSGP